MLFSWLLGGETFGLRLVKIKTSPELNKTYSFKYLGLNWRRGSTQKMPKHSKTAGAYQLWWEFVAMNLMKHKCSPLKLCIETRKESKAELSFFIMICPFYLYGLVAAMLDITAPEDLGNILFVLVILLSISSPNPAVSGHKKVPHILTCSSTNILMYFISHSQSGN